ncbi:MAG: SDR family NAD(P)-dependent oxidoreductase [Gammaproteobacteria bacterium]|uniref:SDR family NAD(P)-dependent oxidoreductase n=1 Tax=Pseudomaricurvus alcaniphilus TaxID=1166482 RepID=UPI00140D3493|nr:SDR family NAD(P)-dependent oxidoreductase [Pseudomaricurvus alcaniphilus]MBR9909332.1 SDR family NAD(P)-dependent oxidoreductase [Gammaproteobacteria bacterium]NHN38268.1 SDR family NAD(P)-dependent oxidoreductase [Pseudomaricurvus alcaniphilus]
MTDVDFTALGIEPAEFKQKYGPWALIAGASHGLGAVFARQLASLGLNCVLLSRRPPVLEELQRELESDYGVETLVVGVDLMTEEAVATIIDKVGEREIGLLVFNAGAPPFTENFLKASADEWAGFVRMNTVTVYRCCHHFGGQMVERGKGGVILVGSHAGFGGTRKLSLYTGTKGFILNLGESLWAEWKDLGVDVLNLVIASTDTPTMREHMAAHGMEVPEGMATPEEIVPLGLAKLGDGPTLVHPDDVDVPAGEKTRGDLRRDHVLESTRISAQFIGD